VWADLPRRRLLEGGVDARLDGELDVVAVDGRLPGVLGVGLRIAQHVHHVAVPQIQELVDHARLEARDAHGLQDRLHHLGIARDVVVLRHRSPPLLPNLLVRSFPSLWSVVARNEDDDDDAAKCGPST
jgi:hypothetical protein